MIEAKMRKSAASLTEPVSAPDKASSSEKETTNSPPIAEQANPWTFDKLVDETGSLRPSVVEEDNEKILELPSPPTTEPKSFGKRKIAITESVDPEPEVAIPARQPSGFNTGSRWANPFGDEFELEESGAGSTTPKASEPAPAIPPKIALDPEISLPPPYSKRNSKQPEQDLRGALREQIEEETRVEDISRNNLSSSRDNLSFEEQLARALSLSTADEEKKQRETARFRQEEEDRDLAAAIAASLADSTPQRDGNEARRMIAQRKEEASARVQRKIDAAMAKKDAKLASAFAKIQEKTSRLPEQMQKVQTETLVDISPEVDPPTSVPQEQERPQTPSQDQHQQGSLYDASPAVTRKETDDDSEGLYSVSPEITASRASRLASPFTLPPPERIQYDPVHEAASSDSARVSTPRTEPVKSRADRLIDIDDSTEEEEKSVNLFEDAAARSRLSMPAFQSTYQPAQQPNGDESAAWLESDEFASMLKSNHSSANEEKKPEEDASRDGARTPTTATLSPQVERETIDFLSGDEDEFASAAGSLANSTGDVDAVAQRESSTPSFTTDTNSHSPYDTESLASQSEAESASLIDVEEDREVESEGHVVEDGEDSSDDDWGSGVRTPGSEWTDVGSVVSEEEVGGQDGSRLIRE